MTTKELVALIQLHDPLGEATVRIEVPELQIGIADPYLRMPTIETAWRGIDWSSSEFILRPTIKLAEAKINGGTN